MGFGEEGVLVDCAVAFESVVAVGALGIAVATGVGVGDGGSWKTICMPGQTIFSLSMSKSWLYEYCFDTTATSTYEFQ